MPEVGIKPKAKKVLNILKNQILSLKPLDSGRSIIKIIVAKSILLYMNKLFFLVGYINSSIKFTFECHLYFLSKAHKFTNYNRIKYRYD